MCKVDTSNSNIPNRRRLSLFFPNVILAAETAKHRPARYKNRTTPPSPCRPTGANNVNKLVHVPLSAAFDKAPFWGWVVHNAAATRPTTRSYRTRVSSMRPDRGSSSGGMHPGGTAMRVHGAITRGNERMWIFHIHTPRCVLPQPTNRAHCAGSRSRAFPGPRRHRNAST